jgi:hypothetical protein
MSNASLPGDGARRSQIRPFGGPLHSPPSSQADDRAFAIALDRLSGLPHAERQAVVAFLSYWQGLPRERRAMLAKAARPDITDDDVARLIGRSLRQLYRYYGYQSFKPRRDDLRRYRGFSNPDDPQD